MTVTELICQPALELLDFFFYLNVLVVGFFESSFVEFFFYVDKKDLVLFASQDLCQLDNPVLCLAKRDNLLFFSELFGHDEKVLQVYCLAIDLRSFLVEK